MLFVPGHGLALGCSEELELGFELGRSDGLELGFMLGAPDGPGGLEECRVV